MVEQVDAQEMKPGSAVTFVNWGNIKIVSVNRKGDTVSEIHAVLDLANLVGVIECSFLTVICWVEENCSWTKISGFQKDNEGNMDCRSRSTQCCLYCSFDNGLWPHYQQSYYWEGRGVEEFHQLRFRGPVLLFLKSVFCFKCVVIVFFSTTPKCLANQRYEMWRRAISSNCKEKVSIFVIMTTRQKANTGREHSHLLFFLLYILCKCPRSSGMESPLLLIYIPDGHTKEVPNKAKQVSTFFFLSKLLHGCQLSTSHKAPLMLRKEK